MWVCLPVGLPLNRRLLSTQPIPPHAATNANPNPNPDAGAIQPIHPRPTHSQTPHPLMQVLVRLKVEYSGFFTVNNQRFGQRSVLAFINLFIMWIYTHCLCGSEQPALRPAVRVAD